jgi:hypothetical protein
LIGLSARFLSTIALSYALSGGLLGLITNFAALAASALAAGAKIALAWIIGLGPLGLIIAGVAALSAAIFYLYKNWEKVKGFFGFGEVAVAPSSIASAGKGGSVVNSNQTVNLTVPPGTPESQQKFLQDAAAKAFESDPLAGLSHNLGMVGP